jgi:hypothetical protein
MSMHDVPAIATVMISGCCYRFADCSPAAGIRRPE